MAKKTKRKISSGLGPTSQAVATVEAPETATVTSSAARSTAVRPSLTAAARRSTAAAVAEFNPDYTYVVRDLKRIGILAGSFVAVLIVLSFFL